MPEPTRHTPQSSTSLLGTVAVLASFALVVCVSGRDMYRNATGIAAQARFDRQTLINRAADCKAGGAPRDPRGAQSRDAGLGLGANQIAEARKYCPAVIEAASALER